MTILAFRDREKIRLAALKQQLFSPTACRDGLYMNARRPFCLHEDFRVENLDVGIREAALSYFRERKIGWHDGRGGLPSNHVCCSQTCCVNFWFPFVGAPDELAVVVRELGYDVDRMLPICKDDPPLSGSLPYVAFEWIGERNYLGELRRGSVAQDAERTRGTSFTSLDFCFRFLRSDGRIQVVAGEWKYTEHYGKQVDLRHSKSGTDRLEQIYGPHLKLPDSQIRQDSPFEALFFDPFDQLMRQQLLCSAMERCEEMEADIVSLLHVAPRANRDLMQRVTSRNLRGRGSDDIHEIWEGLVLPDRFKGVAVEDLLGLVVTKAPTPQTRHYLQARYGGMQ